MASGKEGAGRGGKFAWEKFWSALSTMTLVVIVAGLGLGLTFGMGPLEQKAATLIGSKSPTVTIAWPAVETPKEAGASKAAEGGAKTWLAEQFQEELLTRATRALGSGPTLPDAFAREPLEAVGEAMRTSGWFVGTPTVTRRHDGEIHVEGTWRIAAAVVRDQGKERLVSWDAFPMPVEYQQGRSGLIVILGVASAPTRNNGSIDFLDAWPGEDLKAGLELLALVVRQPWASQVAAIDVSAYSRTKQLEIRTAAGGRVVWGGRPTAPLPGEGATASKLAWIDYLARERHAIDAGLKAIDISGTQPLEIDVTASGGTP